MELRGEQFRQLREALQGAFPSKPKLRLLLREELDVRLDDIVGGSNLIETVEELLAWAEEEGRLVELVNAAVRRNPGNPKLRLFVESFGIILSQARPTPVNHCGSEFEWQDFQLLVTSDRKIRAASDQGDEWGELRLEMNKIKLTLKLIESGQTDTDLLKALGSELYQALFPTKIHGQLRATIAGAASANCGVRLRLLFESPELSALPWEFLYYEGTNTFLTNDIQTALSRYIDIPLQKRDLKAATLPLKILLVISSPTNLAKLYQFPKCLLQIKQSE